MSFQINRKLVIQQGPFDRGVSMILIEKTEQLIKQERGINIKLSHLDYKELKADPKKPGYRIFNIKEAFTARDK